MRGEHPSDDGVATKVAGSSPHARGALRPLRVLAHARGIIPACAGSTSCHREAWMQSRDHPRMRGEHATKHWQRKKYVGSSPHARGAQGSIYARNGRRGIIPACAGSTITMHAKTTSIGDHPRMRGEHPWLHMSILRCMGSSPHARGARNCNSC